MPISWPWKIGRPWCPLWVISAMAGTFEVVAELLERVEVRVRAEDVSVGAGDRVDDALLGDGAVGADLGEAAGEDDREGDLLLDDRTERGDRVADEQRRDVDVVRDVGDRRVAREPEDRVAARVDRIHRRADAVGPGEQLPGDAGVGLALGVGRADDGDRAGTEEAVEVEVAQAHRPTAHVNGLRHGGECTGVPDAPSGSVMLLRRDASRHARDRREDPRSRRRPVARRPAHRSRPVVARELAAQGQEGLVPARHRHRVGRTSPTSTAGSSSRTRSTSTSRRTRRRWRTSSSPPSSPSPSA